MDEHISKRNVNELIKIALYIVQNAQHLDIKVSYSAM